MPGRLRPGPCAARSRRGAGKLDLRLPPGISVEACVERIKAEAAGDTDIRVNVVKAWDANWTALDNPLVVELARGRNGCARRAASIVVRLPGSDARRWRDRGVPAACYGPQPTLSAGIDDYANEQDVIDCAKIYARTTLALMGA